eukprot:m.33366 g.33366  ORF g.33366 m.33366 type:complete len:175 (+) comp15216_c0_seq1:631-1155(+)
MSGTINFSRLAGDRFVTYPLPKGQAMPTEAECAALWASSVCDSQPLAAKFCLPYRTVRPFLCSRVYRRAWLECVALAFAVSQLFFITVVAISTRVLTYLQQVKQVHADKHQMGGKLTDDARERVTQEGKRAPLRGTELARGRRVGGQKLTKSAEATRLLVMAAEEEESERSSAI